MNAVLEIPEKTTELEKLNKKNNCLKIIEEAKQNKMWIYHTESMRWYHPEEFLSLYGRFDHIDSFLEKVQLRSPFEGIKTELEEIDTRNKDLKQFVGKVIDYFTDHKY